MMVMSTRMGTFDIKNASYVLSIIHAVHAQPPHPNKPTPPTTSQARIPRPTTPFQPNQAFKPINHSVPYVSSKVKKMYSHPMITGHATRSRSMVLLLLFLFVCRCRLL